MLDNMDTPTLPREEDRQRGYGRRVQVTAARKVAIIRGLLRGLPDPASGRGLHAIFDHSLGHGAGIAVHEAPLRRVQGAPEGKKRHRAVQAAEQFRRALGPDRKRQDPLRQGHTREPRLCRGLQEQGDRRRIPDASVRPARARGRRQELQADRAGIGRGVGVVHDHAEPHAVHPLEDRHRYGQRRDPLHQRHQRRPDLRLCQGRQDHPHYPRGIRQGRCAFVDHQGAGQGVHAAAAHHAGRARPVSEVHGLFKEPDPPSHEAGGLRCRWRAQHPEPRQVGVRAHQLGRGAGHRGQGDQALQGAWTGRGAGHARLAPPVGQPWTLPERIQPLLESARLLQAAQ